MQPTRAELAAAIQEAHRRGLKITGHLCSVTYPEAAELGMAWAMTLLRCSTPYAEDTLSTEGDRL